MILRAERDRVKDRGRANMSLAWHTAAFTRAKKMPRLATLLGMDRPTPEDIAQAREDHADLIERLGD